MIENKNTIFQQAIGTCRRGIFTAAVFSMFVNVLMLTGPLYMLQIFDRVLSSRNTDTLLFLTLMAVVAFVTLAVLEMVRSAVMVRTASWLDRKLSSPILAKGVEKSLSEPGDHAATGLRDLATLRSFLTGSGLFPIMDAPWTPIFLTVIFLLHPLLGYLALGGAVLLLVLACVNELATKGLLGLSGLSSSANLRHASAASRNAEVVSAMGMMPAILAHWRQGNSVANNLACRAGDRSGMMQSIIKFVRMTLQISVLGLGAWLVLGYELTPGGMIAASILVGRALAPVDQAVGAWRSVISARAAYQRLKIFLENVKLNNSDMALPEPKGEILVENVSFLFPGNANPMIKKLNFKIQAGGALGVIGSMAAGKSTLMRLLVGNIKPQMGHVRFDGMDIAEWASDSRGRYIGYLPQKIQLFEGTVHTNISRMETGDPDKVIAAAKLAGVHDMILKLPKGYDTEIGDDGALLSGGQRQRIALARAVYGNPKLVVMDEPSSSLDQEGELAVLNALVQLKKMGITTIIVAHRPNTLRHVDNIIVLDNGEITMNGPRDKIIKKVSSPRHVVAAKVAS